MFVRGRDDRQIARLGPALRDRGGPGRAVHDAAGGGGRVLAAAARPPPARRSHGARASGGVPAGALPRRRPRGPDGGVAVVRAGGRLLPPDRARAARPVRRAARSRAPHAPRGVAQAPTPSAGRRRPPLRRHRGDRAELVRAGARDRAAPHARGLRRRARLPRAGPRSGPRRASPWAGGT